jgi:hypothetical protein
MDRRDETHERHICYYTRLTAAPGGKSLVRFGVACRTEAQIITSAESWRRIRELLAGEGYMLVEQPESGARPADAGPRSTRDVPRSVRKAE